MSSDSGDVVLTAWLSTAASQLFFMQLGFLCFEVGHVRPVWVSSIIIKNIEDTFVGTFAFILFGYTLSTAKEDYFGLFGSLNHILLWNVPDKLHEEVLVAAMFATTTATIMSGAVLERIKNKGYLAWCFVVIVFIYSVVAHWVWNGRGWLSRLGFMDGAGSCVVHMVGGLSSLVAVYFLGPRTGSVDSRTGRLRPIPDPSNPIIVAIGFFILWYGWFAFNTSSPISVGFDVGNRVGTIALSTILCPIAAALGCFLITRTFPQIHPSSEHLISCCLGGCVAICAGCYSMPLWASYVTGLLCAPVYFGISWYLREQLYIDDPLAVVPIHFGCGLLGVLMEGVFADGKHDWHKGLVFGGFAHFGVQLLGAFVICAYTAIAGVILWKLVLDWLLFQGQDLKVSVLDNYLGTQLFKHNTKMAFEELIAVNTRKSRQLLLGFHEFCVDRFCDEQLDFVIAVHVFLELYDELMDEEPITYDSVRQEQRVRSQTSGMIDLMHNAFSNLRTNSRSDTESTLSSKERGSATAGDSPQIGERAAEYREEKEKHNAKLTLSHSLSGRFGRNISEQQRVIFRCFQAIINTYIRPSADKSVNISDMTRVSILKIYDRSVEHGKIFVHRDLFENAAKEVSRMLFEPCSQFLNNYDRKQLTPTMLVRIPYLINKKWELRWDEKPTKQRGSQTTPPMEDDTNSSDVIISDNHRRGYLMRARLKARAQARVFATSTTDKDVRLSNLYASMDVFSPRQPADVASKQTVDVVIDALQFTNQDDYGIHNRNDNDSKTEDDRSSAEL